MARQRQKEWITCLGRVHKMLLQKKKEEFQTSEKMRCCVQKSGLLRILKDNSCSHIM